MTRRHADEGVDAAVEHRPHLLGDWGNDRLVGGSGNDLLNGDDGDDTLDGGGGGGGGGLNRFDFTSASLPGFGVRDVITHLVGNFFNQGDLIDLSTIDANELLPGNQRFSLDYDGAFTAGALRLMGVVLQGNTDADAFAEFEIQLPKASLSLPDFVF